MEASAKRRFRLRLRTKEVKAISTMTRNTSPAIPKTNPERGLFSRKDFPFDSEVPLGGGILEESVCVIVTGPSDPVFEDGRAAAGETEDTEKLEVVDEEGMEEDDVDRDTLDVGENIELSILDTLFPIPEGTKPPPVVEVLGVGEVVLGDGEVCEVLVPAIASRREKRKSVVYQRM